MLSGKQKTEEIIAEKEKKKDQSCKLVSLHMWQLREKRYNKIFCNEDITFQSSINWVYNGGITIFTASGTIT